MKEEKHNGQRKGEVVQRREGLRVHHPGRRIEGRVRASLRDQHEWVQDSVRGPGRRIRSRRRTEGSGRRERPSGLTASMGKKLFVGNLSFETTDDDLKQAFSNAGTCESASVIKDRASGTSRGFGFGEIASDEEARRAIAELNGRDLRGRTINVSEARERSEGGGPRPS